MNSTVENISLTQRKLHITVAQNEIGAFKQRALQKIGAKANIKGFRPGKVPPAMLEKFYGSEIAYEALNFLLGDSYNKSLAENNIDPITEPRFDSAGPLDETKDYQYTVTVEVRPEFSLKPYAEMEITKQVAIVTDEEITGELSRLQQNLAQLVPTDVDVAVADGLVVTLDFKGTLDGTPFPGGEAKGHVLELGQGHFIREFETKMHGMKKGENRQIDVTFPESYFEKSLAGKLAQFDISVSNIHSKSLPTIDDEMAKDIGKDSLDALKQELRDMLSKRKENQHRRDYAKALREKLAASYDFEIPPSLLKHDHDEATANDPEHDHKKMEEDIRLQFVLHAIADKEEIKVDRQDIDRRMAAIAQMYRQPLEEVRKFYANQENLQRLFTQVRADKALDFVIDHAKMT